LIKPGTSAIGFLYFVTSFQYIFENTSNHSSAADECRRADPEAIGSRKTSAHRCQQCFQVPDFILKAERCQFHFAGR
jgi:hypothetical protein